MSISAEEKNRYLRETATVLAREGFQTLRTQTGRLRVLLDGTPLCELAESDVTYRNEDVNDPERIDAKDKFPDQDIEDFMHFYPDEDGDIADAIEWQPIMPVIRET